MFHIAFYPRHVHVGEFFMPKKKTAPVSCHLIASIQLKTLFRCCSNRLLDLVYFSHDCRFVRRGYAQIAADCVVSTATRRQST